jgi:hypothetical protein
MTTVIILEEHNEAYFAWKYALSENLIRKTGNTLLHFDEHADMGSPNLNVNPATLKDEKAIVDFTYRELNIANFIVPAIFDSLFDKVYWFRQSHYKTTRRGQLLYVRAHNGQGYKLVTHKVELLDKFKKRKKELANSVVPYRFFKAHVKDLVKMRNVCLDIDLDFFSCVQNPTGTYLKIEISKNEYDRFMANPYHRIRYFDQHRVDATCENGKHYFVLNDYRHKEISPIKVSKETIIRRIDEMIGAIRQKQIKPQIVTICRSRFSGYTPNDQWKFIEMTLLRRLLNSIGPITNLHISHIMPVAVK